MSHQKRGQGLVEYSLILLLVAIAAIPLLALFGVGANSLFGKILAVWPS